MNGSLSGERSLASSQSTRPHWSKVVPVVVGVFLSEYVHLVVEICTLFSSIGKCDNQFCFETLCTPAS